MDLSESKVGKKVIKYLEKKYDERFKVEEIILRGMDNPYDEIHCYLENNENIKCKVYIFGMPDEEIDIKDNYYGTIVEKEYKNIIQNLISKTWKNIKIYVDFNVSYFPNEFDKETELSIAMQREPLFFRSIVWVLTDSIEHKEQVIEQLRAKGILAIVHLVLVKEKEFETEENITLNMINEKEKIILKDSVVIK